MRKTLPRSPLFAVFLCFPYLFFLTTTGIRHMGYQQTRGGKLDDAARTSGMGRNQWCLLYLPRATSARGQRDVIYALFFFSRTLASSGSS